MSAWKVAVERQERTTKATKIEIGQPGIRAIKKGFSDRDRLLLPHAERDIANDLARSGELQQATVATAHKIARIAYHLLKTGKPCREESDAEYERKRQERELKHLARRAHKLGYTLTAVPTTAPESSPEPGGEGSF